MLPRILPLALAILLSFLSCQRNDPAAANELPKLAYAPYVSGFTAGIISADANITVEFPFVHAEVERGQAADPTLFRLSPYVEGELVWSQRSKLNFIPAEPLAANTTYTATLQLAQINPTVPDSLASFAFQFTTLKQGLQLSTPRVQPDPLNDDPSRRQIVGQVRSFDYAASQSLEECLRASQGGHALDIDWTHTDRGRQHNFIIKGVARGQNESSVQLTLRGKPLAVDLDSTLQVDVPGLNTFTLTGSEVEQTSDQIITLYFSDPLDVSQELTGLVHLSDGSEMRLLAQGNAILAYPNSRKAGKLELIIEPGIRNAAGGVAETGYNIPIAFTDLKPALEFTGTGTIVPSSEGAIVPFKAVALSSVDVEIIQVYENNVLQFLQDNDLDGVSRITRVGRPVYRGKLPLKAETAIDYLDWNYFAIDISQYIAVEPGAIYRVILNFGPEDSRYPCAEAIATELSNPSEATLTEFNTLSYYSSYEEDYYYRSEGGEDPCNPAYYHGRGIARNFMASDIGLTAKLGASNELLIAATNLQTAQPQPEVSISLYNIQQQAIATSSTGPNGIAVFNVLYQPFMAVANAGTQKAYLHLSDGYALNTSTFDVKGERLVDGTRAFIYGERGVWRPGDSIYLSLILEKQAGDTEATPAIFDLYNPSGQRVAQRAVLPATPEMYSLRTATQPDAPTGLWRAEVRVGNQTLRKNLRIETVMPNRLKVELDLPEAPLQLYNEQSIKLTSRWLHGAPAGALRSDVRFSASSSQLRSDKYSGFTFTDPSKRFSVSDQEVFNGQLNPDGETRFELEIENLNEIPGMLKGRIVTRVFEKTGAFSTVTQSLQLSPYASYVGLKIPAAKSYYGLDASTPQTFELVVLDEAGKRVPRKTVNIEIYDIDWSYWWERNRSNRLASYVANKAQHLAIETTATLKEGLGSYTADLSELSYGRKMIRVIDPVSGHSSASTFYLEDPRWAYDASSRPGGAELLSFNLDKEKYAPGESITVSLPAFPNGNALLSIENGDRVLSYQWVSGQDQPQDIRIEVSPDMAPNAYVSATVIQPHGQTANDQPIRMYGIQPFSVTDPSSRLSPKLNLADELAPEEEFIVEVSEADGRAMSYTLAIVEEGLLDITNFKTPDPHTRFNQHTALGVRTWDMFEHVLGAFTGKLAGLLAIGGDEDLGTEADPRANRFRPVVKYVGPFTLKKGQTAKHSFTMPNYIGSVRAMIVAASEGAHGSAEETRPVKRPLMVLATLPRVLGPGEKVNLPVTVFSMDPKVKEVEVKLEGLQHLNALTSTAFVRFDEPGEQLVNFPLQVDETIGLGTVRVQARGAGFSASDEIELDVRAPNPRRTNVSRAVIEPGETWSTNYLAVGVDGTNEGALEISSNLPINLDERLRYLIRYPHGCLEQTVSGAFPQLYLDRLLEIPERQQASIQRNVNAAVTKLNRFALGDGRFSYWPGSDRYAVWASVYAAHFLVEAQAAGYRIPTDLLSQWSRFAGQQANAWSPNNSSGYYGGDLAITQAYRLFVLAKAQAPQLGAMNRLRNQGKLNAATRDLLAAAYALVGQRDAARKLLSEANAENAKESHFASTYGDNARDLAIGLFTQQLLGDRQAAYKLAEQVAAHLNSERWYSTQSTAWQLISMAHYLEDEPADKPLEYTYELNGASELVKQGELLKVSFLPTPPASPQALKISNTGERRMYVRLVSSGVPSTSVQPAQANNLRLQVSYTDLGGQPLDVSNLPQGQDFLAVVKVTHPGVLPTYRDLALTQVFPSGWEIRNERLEGADKPSGVDYQDIRDDRVLSYFSLGKGKTLTLTTQLNAAYTGEYYLPDRLCEAMYDNDIAARTSGQWVNVLPR